MNKPHESDLHGRVSSLETAMENLAGTVERGFENNNKIFGEMWKSLKAIQENQFQAQKPNLQVWIGFVGIMAMFVTAGWMFINLSIETKFVPLETTIRENQVELETQFRAKDELNNTQWAERQRIIELLWNASPYGKISKYPKGPYHFPTVARQNDPK